MDWVEERLEQRRWAVRRQLLARGREARRARRMKARGFARVALVVTLVVLGILGVGIGRKAMIVMHNAQVIESVRVS